MRGQAGSICENKPPFLPPSICRVTVISKTEFLKGSVSERFLIIQYKLLAIIRSQ